MANARKCDRCEKCFDPFNVPGMMCRFKNPIFQSRNDIREGVVGKKLFNDSSADAYIDLCPECAEMFEAFICGAEPPTAEKEKEPDGVQSFWDLVTGICFGKTEEEVRKMVDEAERRVRGEDSNE